MSLGSEILRVRIWRNRGNGSLKRDKVSLSNIRNGKDYETLSISLFVQKYINRPHRKSS